MIIKLSSDWIRKLVSLPESGMGYQKVTVCLKNGRIIKNLTVENSKELTIPDDIPSFKKGDISEIELAENTKERL